MNRISLAPVAFVIVALAAPAARAQTAQGARVTVCQDGTTTTDVTSRACVRHRGIDVEATRRRRAQRTNTTAYGVYDSRGNVTNGNQIPCGDGTYSASGIHGCDTRGGLAGTTTQTRRNDRGENVQQSDNARRAPARERTPIASGTTARCRDGTVSKAASRRGACVQHGGIAVWYGKRS
jgi:hypothetical protein